MGAAAVVAAAAAVCAWAMLTDRASDKAIDNTHRFMNYLSSLICEFVCGLVKMASDLDQSAHTEPKVCMVRPVRIYTMELRTAVIAPVLSHPSRDLS
ncbi:hypothetical protein RF55_19937 [Lasius niger]|uniref:Secreted protein n=1 Tax=Lasius niger TaxID=67767 RepID=A0A0J7MSI0_LASNI|nr:hypothetical protein RF55_19937 [Lasius niger]